MARGGFFVFEGIDGSGKSTAASMVASRVCEELERECVVTAEPSRLWTGDAVRRANEERIDDLAEALLFVADRALHTQQIRSWVEEGKVVLCDRYYASTIAYQSTALKGRLDDPMEWLWQVNRPVVMTPDITFLFVITPELALARLSGRTGRSKFEKLDFLRGVEAVYQQWSRRDGTFVTVDAERPLEEVVAEVYDQVRKKI